MIYPWQQSQWRRLMAQYQQGRFPHALLLTGPAGLGQLELAGQLAQFLLCKQPTDQPCGCCPSCRLVLANNHPDLWNVVPEERGKNIKIDQIRSLIFNLSQTAQRAGNQVAIIAPAEALNRAAANALLKTLEEPAEKVILLLVSHQPGALPATITSRCQPIKFHAENADIWLNAQLQTLNIAADAHILLKISEQAPLRALELAQNNYLSLRDQFLKHLVLTSQRKTALLAAVPDFLQQDLMLWIDIFISLVSDLIRLHLGVNPSLLTHSDRLSPLQQLTQSHPLPTLLPLQTQLTQTRQWLSNSQIHLNEQLLLESLLICWSK